MLLLCIASLRSASAGSETIHAHGPDTPLSPPTLDVSQVVQWMAERNRERLDRLQLYAVDRHYQLEYRGFPKNEQASMDVHMISDDPTSKRFYVISKTGSRLLIDRVLMKLLTAETEAAHDPSRTSLTTDNYAFTLLGNETTATGQRLYTITAEPKLENKYLFRGRIWVDANDFAVARIDAEPAQNPSLLISKTQIHYTYEKVKGFWFPAKSESKTRVRVGGTATLTISYSHYEVVAKSNPSTPHIGVGK